MDKDTPIILQSISHLKEDIRFSMEEIRHLREDLKEYKESNDKLVNKNKLRISQILLVGALGGYAGTHLPSALGGDDNRPPLYLKKEKVVIEKKIKQPKEGE